MTASQELARAVEIYVAVHFAVMGLSHIVQPKVWVEFFTLMRAQGHTGVFVNGFLSLIFGSIIIAFHNVWTGWDVVVTLIGWAQVLKATLAFTYPALAMRGLNLVSLERAWQFQAAGAVALAVTGWLVVRLAAG